MISMVIMDPKKSEIKDFEECFRDLVAFHSNEKLEVRAFLKEPEVRRLIDENPLVHMAVMDVTMRDGIETAKALRSTQPEAEILVVADMSVSPMRYMTPGIRASSLLLRPFPEEMLKETCEEFFENCCSSLSGLKQERNFLVENNDGKTMLPYSSIFYFEAREKKIFVRTLNEEYGIYDTMDRLQNDLPEEFLRCHRSFIINRTLIEKVRFSENLIYMKKQVSVPLSRSYKGALKEFMNG